MRTWLLVTVIVPFVWILAPRARACVVPTDGMVVTEDTTFCAGTYVLPSGITIGAAGITVTGDNTIIQSTAQTGQGLTAVGLANVTVRSLAIDGYFHGMHFDDCDGLTIEDCTVSGTPYVGGFLNIFAGPVSSYGHAIWVSNSDHAVLRGNEVGGQQNGISLFFCTQALVEYNQASRNSGWGIQLYDTDDSTIQFNTANDCIRDGGGDAANLLIVYGSCNNQILHNTLLRGGDGVFLAGATHQLEPRPNNDNYFYGNDCSGSPNNGFEATFSQRNVFENNVSDWCNYGYWLGYSSASVIRGNQANDCWTAGVAIEHGYDNTIESNTLNGSMYGIRLWTDDDASLVAVFTDNLDSHGYTITGNTITGNEYGIRCEGYNASRRSYDYTIANNIVDENRIGMFLQRTADSVVRSNRIRDNSNYGLWYGYSADGNLTYDNYIANPQNAYDDSNNTWNIAKTAGVNILGRPYLGGNFWSDYGGLDTDGDALGNTAIPHTAGGNILTGGDMLPLLDVSDTDGDGLADEWELTYFPDLSEAPGGDPDQDGLTTSEEYVLHTNPAVADTDSDGLNDYDEVNLYGTDPNDADCDDDELIDSHEIATGCNPYDPDSDDDGLPDGWEVEHNLDPLVNDANLDADEDGLSNREEFEIGSDPHLPDTDNDGIRDPDEWTAGSDPADPYSYPVSWDVLPHNPSYFPYVDVNGAPEPDYWPRADGSVLAANGKIYSVGGGGPSDYVDASYVKYLQFIQSGFSIYDIGTQNWSCARWDGTGPTGYNNCNGTAGPVRGQGTYTGPSQCFAYDRDADGTDEIFVLAGFRVTNGWFAIYDPDTDAWTASAPCPSEGVPPSIYWATANEWEGRAYVYGGFRHGPDGSTFHVYDIATDTWMRLPNGPVQLAKHCGEIVDGRMYLIGGRQDNVDYSTGVFVYDIAAATWNTSAAAPLPVGVNQAASVVRDGQIYVVGGTTATAMWSSQIQVYAPQTNHWSRLAPLPEPRAREGAVVVSDGLYVVDGIGPATNGGGDENKSDLWMLDFGVLTRPRAIADTPAAGSGVVPIHYRLYDTDASVCAVTVEYCDATASATWHPASRAPFGEPAARLASALTGVAHSYMWNAIGDLGQDATATIRLRITPTQNGDETGTPTTTDWFTVNTGVTPGDCNCDGEINFFDIDFFVVALTNPAGFAVAYPECNVINADCNDDQAVNFFDIDPFVMLLTR